jgi:damage-control phosphatase, subfamily I
MQTHLDCIPCFLHQSLEAARMATHDETIHTKVMKQVMGFLQTMDFTCSPPEISREVHRIIKQTTGVNDPYLLVKKNANEQAKKQRSVLEKMIRKSDDPLLMAVKVAIIGNVIDFGTMNRFNIEEMVKTLSKIPFHSQGYALFKKRLEHNTQSILYLADNTGEVIFDYLLLKELSTLNKDITYVVKSTPIINDATKEDALFAEIDTLATIIEGDEGNDFSAPGMVLSYATPSFQEALGKVDMVISKGQGNYESLSALDREVFFLLMIKCPLVARDIGIDVGTMVLKVRS